MLNPLFGTSLNPLYFSAQYPEGSLFITRLFVQYANRFGANATPKGLNLTNWGDNTTFTTSSGGTTIKVQDQYNVSSTSAKWTSVQNTLNEAKTSNSSWLYFNFSSGVYSFLGIPNIPTVSNSINPSLDTYFNNNTSGRFGVIIMDFVNASRCSKIIATNNI